MNDDTSHYTTLMSLVC